MSVSAQAVPMFSDNYAWLLRDGATGAVGIVDPADPAAVIRAVDAAGEKLDAIFLTHHHADHVAGTDAVRARYGCQVIGARADSHRLPRLDVAVSPGDHVAFGGGAITRQSRGDVGCRPVPHEDGGQEVAKLVEAHRRVSCHVELQPTPPSRQHGSREPSGPANQTASAGCAMNRTPLRLVLRVTTVTHQNFSTRGPSEP